MRRKLMLVLMLAVFSITSFLPTIDVFAAGKTATLVDLRFVPIKGWSIVFKVTGDWKDSDLKGNTLNVAGHTFNLYCNFRDDNHISCTMESLGQFIGQTATIFFAGQSFSAIVPERKSAAVSLECPDDGWEQVYVYFEDSEGYAYAEWIAYFPASTYTTEEAAAELVALLESSWEIEIVYYLITDVSCEFDKGT